jgi:hypothetical protein
MIQVVPSVDRAAEETKISVARARLACPSRVGKRVIVDGPRTGV